MGENLTAFLVFTGRPLPDKVRWGVVRVVSGANSAWTSFTPFRRIKLYVDTPNMRMSKTWRGYEKKDV